MLLTSRFRSIAIVLFLGLRLNDGVFAFAAGAENAGSCGLLPTISDTLYPVIEEVLPDSPAQDAGLAPGMQMVSINGKNAACMGIDQLRQSLRGRSGSKLTLELLQGEETIKVTVALKELQQFNENPYLKRTRVDKPAYPVGTDYLHAGFYAIDLPSLLRSEAREGAEVVEFIVGKAKDDSLLHEIGRFNAQLLADQSSESNNCQPDLVQLVRINTEDPELKPLLEHFRIKSCPSYIFVASPSVAIKDYIDVVRHKMSSEEIQEHLADLMLSRSKGDEFLPFIKPGLSTKWAKITNREIRQAQAAKTGMDK